MREKNHDAITTEIRVSIDKACNEFFKRRNMPTGRDALMAKFMFEQSYAERIKKKTT